MAKAKVFSTHPLFDEARVILNADCDVEYWAKPERPTRQEIASRIKDKDGLVCLLTDRINEDLLRAAPKLRIVANVAVGYDNLDVPACAKRGVIATNTPGVLDETTADFAWTLLMAVARRLVEGDTYARNGSWKGWNLDQMCGTDVWGKTLGIIGFGRIGRAVARRAAGFKMRILYNATKPAPIEIEKELGAEFRDLNLLLAESDFVTLHVPLNSETSGLLDVPKFFRMKPTAFVINTARGPVIDEAALVHALEAGKIAGAGLDVFEQEPFIHPGLKRSNVVMAPHMGSASVETRSKMAAMAAHNVAALFSGQRPPNMLNPDVFEKS
jgi:glyoxylate reductase